MSNLLILGAGGMGHMIYEMVGEFGGYDKVSFLDDAKKESAVVGKLVDYQDFRGEYDCAIAAFGDNKLRVSWIEKLIACGYTVPSVIHPSAVVSPSVEIGVGCFVLPRAVINTRAKLEMGCLVNSGAVVDHDAVLEKGCHISLGSVIRAYCQIAACRKVADGKVVYARRRKIDGVDNGALEDALYAFGFGNKCSYVRPFGAGHINETYAVYMPNEEGEDELMYVLQRVNKNVFKNPDAVMENIFGVTEFLRRVIREDGGDPDRETLSYIKTKIGENYFEDTDGFPWRCYNYIADSVCYQSAENTEQFYQSARSFGHFLKQLGDYPAETLHETIPKFHDTESRLADFKRALKRDVKNRALTCRREIRFVLDREKDCSVLMEQVRQGNLPLRVTHNDTKLNNILFDEETNKGLCIIDLDTIMPGLALSDYGDSIRFGASTAAEDEQDLNKVHFSLELFEAYTKGYLEAAGDVLTPTEKEYLPWGARLLTLECGIRFLTDYLQGDTYFKTEYTDHNLVRARTQFKLVDEMEQHFDEMREIVKKYS